MSNQFCCKHLNFGKSHRVGTFFERRGLQLPVVLSRHSVLSQDILKIHFGCLGFVLVGWCLGLGFCLNVDVLSIS